MRCSRPWWVYLNSQDFVPVFDDLQLESGAIGCRDQAF